MRNIAVVDSGPLIALFDRDDAHHRQVVEFLARYPASRLLATWAVLNETCALLSSRVGKQAELDFLAWVERGGVAIAGQGPDSLPRIRALIEKYQDLPFDFADASVAVLAAEAGLAHVLTLDRDFDICRDARGRRLRNLLGATPTRGRRSA